MPTIPITLITGFLGAGKSSLINRIIAAFPERKLGLIVNEFGTVRLESQILEAHDDDIVELPNGCMCCVLRGDLVTTVAGFLDKRPDIDHLIIEASGLSDPYPIAQTFLQDSLGDRVRFDAVLTVIDASNFEATIKDFTTCIKQLRLADFVILSKSELASEVEIKRVRHQVSMFAPKVPVLRVDDPEVPGLILDTHDLDHHDLASTPVVFGKSPGAAGPGLLKAGAARKTAGHGPGGNKTGIRISHRVEHEVVDTLFFSTDQVLDFLRFNEVLENLPPQIIRVKGFLYLNTPSGEEIKTVIQSVAQRNSVDFQPWKPGEQRRSAVVFIGKGFDIAALRTRLEASVVES